MVSVILPNYKHAPYLRLRIDSILNQTYQDFELIILDDFSPDNSRDVIEEYRNNPHISHIVYNEENSGSTFKQWKKGIELAKGEYIWIAESDDYADTTFLEKAIKTIEKYNSVLCFTQTTIVDKDNNTVMKQPEIISGSDYMDINQFKKEFMLFSNPICNASMAVFKKNALPDTLWNNITNFRYCGDWLLWGSFLSDGKTTVSEVKEYLNFFRTHSVNVSNKSEDNGLGIIEGYEVSRYITNSLNIKRDKGYSLNWYYKWQSFKLKFSFSSSVNKKILFMFISKQPMVAYFELKRLISRLISK